VRAEPATLAISSSPNESNGAATPIPSGSLDSCVPHAERKINLVLNGELLRMLDTQATANAFEPSPRRAPRMDPGVEATKRLMAAILADDFRHDRARGNVLLAPLDSAVRRAGPTRGQATTQATVNSTGEIIALELIRGQPHDWTAVLKDFRQQSSSKRVRVPDGMAGLRITLSVSASVQRASGEAVESSSVGLDGPSASTGLAMTGMFDLADLSNTSARMLAIRIVKEELL
jgi:hypothetical protein